MRQDLDSCVSGSGEQVGVNPAESRCRKIMLFDEAQDAFVRRSFDDRQCLQQLQHFRPPPDVAQGHLTNDERMAPNCAVVQSFLQIGICLSEMIDPDGRIDQGHRDGRRRRGARARLSEPPIAARRPALRWAINARSPA